MSSSFNLQFSVAPFPIGFQGDLNAYATQLVANLSATITGNFLTGQIGGTVPTSNIGPWANGTQWWFWNASLPTPAYESEFSLLQPEYNSIINGDNQVWSRWGTNPSNTGVGATAGYFGSDKWKYTGSMATGQATISQQAAGITGGQFPYTPNQNIEYCHTILVTSSQASLAAGDHFEISQGIEQQLARVLFNVNTSLGIALRSSITGSFYVSIVDSAFSNSWVGQCVIPTANVWTFFPFPNIAAFPAASTLGSTDTSVAYWVRICAAAGATFSGGSNNAWSAANNVAGLGQTNLFAANNNRLDFTFVKHQPGAIVTPFVVKPFDESLLRCRRYYWSSYAYGVAPGTASVTGYLMGIWASSSAVVCGIRYPVKMRAAPSGTGLLTYDTLGSSNGTTDINSGATAITTSSHNSTDEVFASFAATGTTGHVAGFFVTADVDY